MVASEKLIHALEAQKAKEDQLAFGFARRESRPYRLDVEDDGVRVHLELEDFDRLGVMLTAVKVRSTARVLESEAPASLDNQIDRAINDIRCLSGEFRLIEKDTASLAAILCTPPPRDDSPQYYELVLRCGAELTLRHFTVDRGQCSRRPSSANMSMQSFHALISHLVRLLSRSESQAVAGPTRKTPAR